MGRGLGGDDSKTRHVLRYPAGYQRIDIIACVSLIAGSSRRIVSMRTKDSSVNAAGSHWLHKFLVAAVVTGHDSRARYCGLTALK